MFFRFGEIVFASAIIGCCSVLGFIMTWLAVPTWGILGGLTYFFAVKLKKRDNG